MMPTTETVKQAAKEKKPPASKPKSPKNASRPPYFDEMIKDALLALKETGGSSPFAFCKYIEENQKSALPGNFRNILGLQLKNSAAKGKLIKVKAWYKLSDAVKKAAPKAVSAKKKGEKAKHIVDDDAAPTKKKRKKAKQNADDAPKPAKKKGEKAKQIVEAGGAKPKKAVAAKSKKAAAGAPAKKAKTNAKKARAQVGLCSTGKYNNSPCDISETLKKVSLSTVMMSTSSSSLTSDCFT